MRPLHGNVYCAGHARHAERLHADEGSHDPSCATLVADRPGSTTPVGKSVPHNFFSRTRAHREERDRDVQVRPFHGNVCCAGHARARRTAPRWRRVARPFMRDTGCRSTRVHNTFGSHNSKSLPQCLLTQSCRTADERARLRKRALREGRDRDVKPRYPVEECALRRSRAARTSGDMLSDRPHISRLCATRESGPQAGSPCPAHKSIQHAHASRHASHDSRAARQHLNPPA